MGLTNSNSLIRLHLQHTLLQRNGVHLNNSYLGLILLGVYGWQWKFDWKNLVHLYDEVAHIAEVRRDRVQDEFIYHRHLFRSISNAEESVCVCKDQAALTLLPLHLVLSHL